MAEIVVTSLAILAAVYIGYPFYQSRRQLLSFNLNHTAEDLEARKTEVYAAIKDIEFDYQMGKLSEEDYQELRNQYKAEAVQLLKKLDQLHQPHRKKRSSQAAKAKANAFCPQCGKPMNRTDRFCSNCGSAAPGTKNFKS